MIAQAEVVVEATAADAFRIFTEEIGFWWRRDSHYWNDAERALYVRLEPGVGGRFVEVYDADDDSGFEVGRVTAWEPGERLAFSWTQADWPGDAATDVEVTFEPVEGGTRVRLEHGGFERVSEDAGIAAGYGAGWEEILGWYAGQVRTEARR